MSAPWGAPDSATSPVLTLQPGQQLIGYPPSGPMGEVVTIEQRKIVILHLERDSLTEETVRQLLAEHAGIGSATSTASAGEGEDIEKIEIPINKDGRARGTSLVTFRTAELAFKAIAALDGRQIGSGSSGGRRLAARLASEGVSTGKGFGDRLGYRAGKPAYQQQNLLVDVRLQHRHPQLRHRMWLA
ncbi:uncharacterized protein CTHT_0026230 [Thermochaetoides thermophila DSM 1495]|uniref:RRM domain-containing protein n=1 Tax=Chaetomium thermophilum (strain DSM 1495 / CBS 144.50 / IMI 039719) TaxID=759272 RepID=G0S6C1_CHATD|nr:hypothetical protein CTHT_0026230 [Thermochaetoides thermophila DSM 1495]EGS20785.1 hypothetical protein CTHT_0026230 [Thermochaetoides thermophila DSM 1495]